MMLTLVNSPSCTSEFFEPAYIICCSGLHPKEEERCDIDREDVYSMGRIPTLRTYKNEAKRIRRPAIIMLVAIAVGHIARLVSR